MAGRAPHPPCLQIPPFAARGPLRRALACHRHRSFRDEEVNWDYVRVLADGECVSVDGTHLGHNLPDGSGNRYCINLVSVAGYPTDGA